MNVVIYYSNAGECRKIAEYIAEKLDYPMLEMTSLTDFVFDNLVVVFPVYCQNIPAAVKAVFRKIKAGNVFVTAVYGRMSYGNVLWECQKSRSWKIIGGAYVPAAHCYIDDDKPFERWNELDFIKDVFENPQEIKIPRSFKNPLANLFMEERSRIGVKILRNSKCTGCGLCREICTEKRCIRCMKCVKSCPTDALYIRCNAFMTLYLKKRKKDKTVVYR